MLKISADPIAFTIGSLTVTWYGILLAAAVISMIIIIPRDARRLGINRDLYGFFLWCILGGLVGSRLTHVIGQWERFIGDPRTIFGFDGQAQNGMIIGVFAAALIYMAVTKMRFPMLLRIGDSITRATPLALAMGRLGCTITGCCHGKPSPFEYFPGAITYTERAAIPRFADGYLLYQNSHTVPLYPTQIYHIAWNLITLAVVWRFRDRFKPPGSLLFFYFCLYAAGDFGIRFLRIGEHVVLGLHQAQIMNLAVLAVFLPWMIIKMRGYQATSESEQEAEST